MQKIHRFPLAPAGGSLRKSTMRPNRSRTPGRRGLRAAAFTVCATAAAWVTSCTKPTPPPPPALSVIVAQPVQKWVTEWNQYTGRLDARESVEIRPRVGGFIDAIHFQEGKQVKEGD